MMVACQSSSVRESLSRDYDLLRRPRAEPGTSREFAFAKDLGPEDSGTEVTLPSVQIEGMRSTDRRLAGGAADELADLATMQLDMQFVVNVCAEAAAFAAMLPRSSGG
jgi:hypothetical protein